MDLYSPHSTQIFHLKIWLKSKSLWTVTGNDSIWPQLDITTSNNISKLDWFLLIALFFQSDILKKGVESVSFYPCPDPRQMDQFHLVSELAYSSVNTVSLLASMYQVTFLWVVPKTIDECAIFLVQPLSAFPGFSSSSEFRAWLLITCFHAKSGNLCFILSL